MFDLARDVAIDLCNALKKQVIRDIYYPVRTYILDNLSHNPFSSTSSSVGVLPWHFRFYADDKGSYLNHDLQINDTLNTVFARLLPRHSMFYVVDDVYEYPLSEHGAVIVEDGFVFDIYLCICLSSGKVLKVEISNNEMQNPTQFAISHFNFADGVLSGVFNDSMPIEHNLFGCDETIVMKGGYTAVSELISDISHQIDEVRLVTG